VRSTLLCRYGSLSLIIIPLALVAAVFGAPAPAAAPPAPPTAPPTVAILPTDAPPPPTARPLATLAPAPRATPLQSQPSYPAPETPTPPAAPPTPIATPRFHVGIQAGHWRADELPSEQTHLHISAGTSAGGYSEAQVTFDIARRAAALLESIGVTVDVLPATVPPGYSADAFVALHANGFAQTSARGFKVATAWATSPASQRLFIALTAEYERATGLPRHGAATADMRGYYAFNYRRYAHAVARTTPAAIVEMGFLTNPDDRALLTQYPDVAAVGIANGIVRYLNERDPNDRAALQPPDFGVWHGGAANGLDVRAAPRDDAQAVLHIDSDRPVIPFEEREGWFRVVVAGAWDVVGWVRKDGLVRMPGY
jgi:N-acetylmuramoyl-L-alanine amidase